MLNISRWTGQGGSYRTVQSIPWTTICWTFFRTYLLDRESDYILVGDEVVVPKAGKSTYLVSLFGKAIPGLSFLAVSLVSVDRKRSYPMVMEQIVRGTPSSNQGVCASEHQANTETATPKHKRGRPKGSRNRNKNVVVLSDVLKQLQTMVKGLLHWQLDPLRYFVLDGYFGHNNALQMAKQCRLHLISKLRTDAALHLPPTTPYAGKGRPRIYGERLNPRQIDAKYCLSTDTIGNLKTEVYQMEARHKKFADELNVVCILKTNLTTKQQAHVLLFSSDLTLDAEKMIEYYSLRFQIEFNFRDAKQYWGLQDFMNVNKIPVNNAVNLSMFMVSVSAKLTDTFRCPNTEFSVLDLKARYRGAKYLHETLKILPKKPDTIVIEQIAQRLGSIGAIHQTQQKLNPG